MEGYFNKIFLLIPVKKWILKGQSVLAANKHENSKDSLLFYNIRRKRVVPTIKCYRNIN